jgi:hypothetical protein
MSNQKGGLMKDIHQIYSYADKDGTQHFGFGVDTKTGELFWNHKKVVTDQKLTLSWWVNGAIILGALSTMALAIMEGYKLAQ